MTLIVLLGRNAPDLRTPITAKPVADLDRKAKLNMPITINKLAIMLM